MRARRSYLNLENQQTESRQRYLYFTNFYEPLFMVNNN